jgi:hypothetical protein
MSEKLVKGEKLGLFISILIYISSLIFFGVTAESPLALVFAGLMPFLLFIGLFFYSVHMHTEGWILWLLPLVFPAIFLIMLGFVPTPLDVPTLAVINVILSYLVAFIVLMIIGLRHMIDVDTRNNMIKREREGYHKHINQLKSELDTTKEVLDHTQSELHGKHHELEHTKHELSETLTKLRITKENFSINLRSIEDKCKAINFVIGRVYSDKKGADSAIRDALRIDPHLYNTFSNLSATYTDKDSDRLLNILEKIHGRLVLLEQREDDLFKIKKGKLPVIRQEEDTILDILARNDKDPIRYYHGEAKEICNKLMKFLRDSKFS